MAGRDSHLRGVLMMVGSCALLSAMSVLVRCARDVVDSYKMCLFRFAIGMAILVTGALLGWIRLTFVRGRLLFLRGLFGGAAVTAFFLAINHIGLAQGTVISQSFPIFATLGGMIFLAERVGPAKWAAILLAFAGLYLTSAGPSGWFADVSGYHAVALGGAICAGVAVVLVKKLRETDSPQAIYLAQCAVGFWLVFVPAGRTPAEIDMGWSMVLLAIGITAAAAQLLMTAAFRHVSVSTGSPLMLLMSVFNTVVGVTVFHEEITAVNLTGMALVVASCAFIAFKRRTPPPGRADRATPWLAPPAGG